MKYAEFAALCQREWFHDPDLRGDVCALTLTRASLSELSEDVVTIGGDPCRSLVLRVPADCGHGIAGALAAELANPVTRTPVKVTGEASLDMYQVNRVVPAAVLASGAADL